MHSPPEPKREIDDATPLMAQYLAIKAENPDSLLFYRMGDFYELFFDDAVAAAAALDIMLTKRGKHNGADIQMCGVPVHAADTYLQRLIRKGFRVAVCEQLEDPAAAKRRGAKAVVKRDVIRVVTPGTLTEDSLLDARRHNYLAALAEVRGALGLAWVDVSTGAFSVEGPPEASLAAALARLEPGEILVPDRMLQTPALFELFAQWKSRLTPLPAARFESEGGRRRLEMLYGVAALDGFGEFSRAEVAACGALVDYIELTQKGRIPRLSPPRRELAGAVMEIDPATRRNLELHETLTGERNGSLLSVIDRTVTGAGGRLLAQRLAAPLTDPAEIARRLDAVEFFVHEETLRKALRTLLSRAPDIERALSRLSVGRGGPRDLAGIREGLARAAETRAALSETQRLPDALQEATRDLGHHAALIDRLARALRPDPPILTRDGGFIAEGYAAELDELRTLRDESRQLIANLQAKYARDTGIASLKIRHNNVIGYFIEITSTHADKISAGDRLFIQRQSMANAVRYTTTELSELQSKIDRAADQALALELQLFEDLVKEATARAEPIALAADALARIDVAAGLAELAATRRYARPLVDNSRVFAIAAGRHPVVEAALATSHAPDFVVNGCDLAPAQRLWLVTGPNMAGKSTFLRQNALIAILAQMGSFVPAEAAEIGIVDRLFSRVGAADDLARGRSTFMVEMLETAAILNLATDRSLVILDEIGRGTATFDGLSIAWATLEHLHEANRCRALFATHYHELTALAVRLDALSPHTMRIKEWQSEVVFLHEVIAGAADRSYGIHVAKLAGLPSSVIARAEEVLATLERGEQSGAVTKLVDDLPLFSVTARTSPKSESKSAVEDALAAVNPDELTPISALELIYRLKASLKR